MRFILAGVVCILLLGAWGVRQIDNMLQPAADHPAPALFQVEAGDSMNGVARRLEERGILRSARATRWLARIEGLDGQLQVGEYELSPDQTPQSILAIITTGQVKTWSLTIPEGSRALEIAQRIQDEGLGNARHFMEATNDPEWAAALGLPGPSLEGYLYPETYMVNLSKWDTREFIQRTDECFVEFARLVCHLRHFRFERVDFARKASVCGIIIFPAPVL